MNRTNFHLASQGSANGTGESGFKVRSPRPEKKHQQHDHRGCSNRTTPGNKRSHNTLPNYPQCAPPARFVEEVHHHVRQKTEAVAE